MTKNYGRFDNDKMCQVALCKAVLRLKSISTASTFASFLHGGGFRGYRAGASIHVQLLFQDADQVLLEAANDWLVDVYQWDHSTKKPRQCHCLVENVNASVPNAISH